MGCLRALLGTHSLHLRVNHLLDLGCQFLKRRAGPHGVQGIARLAPELLAQHCFYCVRCQQIRNLRTLGQYIRQFNLNGGHGNSFFMAANLVLRKRNDLAIGLVFPSWAARATCPIITFRTNFGTRARRPSPPQPHHPKPDRYRRRQSRITETTYNLEDTVQSVQRAVGTPVAQTYAR